MMERETSYKRTVSVGPALKVRESAVPVGYGGSRERVGAGGALAGITGRMPNGDPPSLMLWGLEEERKD